MSPTIATVLQVVTLLAVVGNWAYTAGKWGAKIEGHEKRIDDHEGRIRVVERG